MLRHFDTHFFQVSGKFVYFDPYILEKWRKFSTPIFHQNWAKCIDPGGNAFHPMWWECSCTEYIPRNMPWWRHQMETFSALLAFCAENSPVPVNSPHKGQWRGALMFSLICTWINNWVNNAEAGDLRRHRAHCDVSVMHRVCVMLCFVVIRCCPIYPVCASGSLRWHRGNHRIAPCECIAVAS